VGQYGIGNSEKYNPAWPNTSALIRTGIAHHESFGSMTSTHMPPTIGKRLLAAYLRLPTYNSDSPTDITAVPEP
jgi:hypothetical protein